VSFKLDEGQAADDATLASLDGVTAVRRDQDSTELTSVELRRTVPALLGHLERNGLRLRELGTHSATLEDVFVSLTGRHLRDA
jgi:ABC-2 type transport system ATP-binding protein